jgi:DNA-binding transcriptional regulator YiaG
MGRTLNEVIDGLSTAQREVVERGSALIADGLSLREIRKTLNLTQEDVARRL